MNPYKIYAGGTFHETEQVLKVFSPYSGELVGETYIAGKELVEQIISNGLKLEAEMAGLPAYQRSEILRNVATMILEKKELLAGLICKESAKPYRYAMGEVMRTSQTFSIASEEAKRISGEHLDIEWTSAGRGKEAWVKDFPIGLIAGISPFNFPINLAAHKMAPAIAAGNPIILKPSSRTPLSILELAKIIDETSLPAGGVSILPMTRETGELLVVDDRIKLLTFTGSPAVGWSMKSKAGRKKVVLELGGNAGVYFGRSAKLDTSINQIVIGAFAFSGQVCIHTQRIFVHQSRFEEFAESMIDKASRLVSGPPEDPLTEISSMIDADNAKRVEKWVDEAVSDGAKVLLGGIRQGQMYPATILTNTHQDMKVCSHEVFGPVISIDPVKSIEEAVALINDTRYGLQAGVFTDSIDEMNYAYNNLEVGGVIINDVPTFRVDHMPYGGIKDSGFGREGIKYAIREMMEPKLLVKNK